MSDLVLVVLAVIPAGIAPGAGVAYLWSRCFDP
jgi:hypothetical protein